MATQKKTRSRSKSSGSSNGSRSTGRSRSSQGNRRNGGDARSASQKVEKYRFAKNVEGIGTAAEREYQHYAEQDPWKLDDDLPDVLLDVPVVKLDHLHFELDNLDAHVALNAYVLDLVKLKVGVDVHLGRVALDIKGVEAQALVKVRLDHVAAVVDRVMTTLDRNPELLESLGEAVEDIGAGTGDMLGESGEAVEDVGEGTEQALEHIGQGAGEGVGEIGQGAGQAVGQVGQGAGEAVGDVGEGAGEAVGDVGEGAGQAVGNLDELVAGLAGGSQDGGSAGELAEGAGDIGVSAGDIAKIATKIAAQELRSAVTSEAKGLRVAASRKAKEIGERRRERKAEDFHATPAAVDLADDLDVDLDEVDGTGADDRITVADVRKAAREQE
jgi:pyruvate/2-oxoglutarate dehydrogenase complex dihydrolipoamide acyltransferase (E2) component